MACNCSLKPGMPRDRISSTVRVRTFARGLSIRFESALVQDAGNSFSLMPSIVSSMKMTCFSPRAQDRQESSRRNSCAALVFAERDQRIANALEFFRCGVEGIAQAFAQVCEHDFRPVGVTRCDPKRGGTEFLVGRS